MDLPTIPDSLNAFATGFGVALALWCAADKEPGWVAWIVFFTALNLVGWLT